MYFQHAPEIWAEYPELVAGAAFTTGIGADADVEARVAKFYAVAEERLAAGPESEFPEIRAWRRAFAKMGLKPTQYRCASEALLRRFKRERELPRIHPLIDLCNAISLAYAIPVAAIDVAEVAGGLEVRPARGDEEYLTFGGEIEHPAPGEVVFADEAGRAHARRWTNRQSGRSAVRDATGEVLIVAEALHGTAARDVPALLETVAAELAEVWPGTPVTAVLGAAHPRLEFAPAAQP
ncbi:B3/B4 domain-containing protein [Actinomadura kijaniata]|uniref:B3/B4 domain-containing protein n=1 Tax=Actinomadura kijaniata TaxID=46161 RepID=UPI003F1BB7FC